MYRYIISFLMIFFLFGCEDKSSFEHIIQKLKNDKNTTIANKIKADVNITLVNKEPQKIIKEQITDLNLTTTSGKKIHIKFINDGIKFEKYKNKIVLLDIFTTWCPPCLESIPHLNTLQKKYKKKLQIIGILMEENKPNSELKKFIKKYNIKYPITNSKENFTLVDNWGGVSGYPTLIIFDKKGRYFNHYNGSPPIEMLESDIKKALRKK